MTQPKRYFLIACEILFREISYCVARSKNIIDVHFLPKGLHDMGQEKMSSNIQKEIDKIDKNKYDAVLLGYALCNNGVCGLHSDSQLVIPKAHDCITLLLGSQKAYNDYFNNFPGTYFKSTGWIERENDSTNNAESIPSQLGITKVYEEYVEKYGEENAKYLMETLGDWTKNYNKLAYIDTISGYFDAYKKQTEQDAKEKGWAYEELKGSLRLIQNLVDGEWNKDEFLLVKPGEKIKAVYNGQIMSACSNCQP